MIKAVIFDVDGVIFDTEKVWKEAFYKSLEKFNLDLDENWRTGHLVGVSKDNFIEAEQPFFPEISVREWRSFMHDYVLDACKAGRVDFKSGVLDIWKFLEQNHIKKAIATGGDGVTMDYMFTRLGVNLHEVFPVVVKGVDVPYAKPKPDIFLLAARKLSLPADECVVLEDSLNGVRAGIGAGCKTIMVLDQVTPDDFAKKNCLSICNNLFEAKAKIEELL